MSSPERGEEFGGPSDAFASSQHCFLLSELEFCFYKWPQLQENSLSPSLNYR